jgi:3-oxoacyl-[acyl-carrier protein] reductase
MNKSINRRFEDKVVLITGASTGIGRAVALAFAREGAKVVANYRDNQKAADSLIAEITDAGGAAIAVQADVSQGGQVQRLFATVTEAFAGRLDVLFNNAGQWMDRISTTECSEELWDKMFDTNVKSVFLCCRSAIPLMQAKRCGVIINTGSIAGHTGGGGGTLAYAASKAAVHTMTRSLAKELAPMGIRVCGVAPGLVDTPLLHRHEKPEMIEKLKGLTPLNRLAAPSEVADAVLFLASNEASYITGEIIEVNGGLLMH